MEPKLIPPNPKLMDDLSARLYRLMSADMAWIKEYEAETGKSAFEVEGENEDENLFS